VVFDGDIVELVDESLFEGCEDECCVSVFAGSTGSTDAMDVNISTCRGANLNDLCDTRIINTAGTTISSSIQWGVRNIRGKEDGANVCRAECSGDFSTLILIFL